MRRRQLDPDTIARLMARQLDGAPDAVVWLCRRRSSSLPGKRREPRPPGKSSPRAPPPPPPPTTYSVGDYVWTQHATGRQIGRIEDARPKIRFGDDWWNVRVRCDDGVWTLPHLRRVVCSLTPMEIYSYRKAGVLPPKGAP